MEEITQLFLPADPRKTSNEVGLLGTQSKTADQSDFRGKEGEHSPQGTQPETSAVLVGGRA